MKAIRDNAEVAVRQLLRDTAKKMGTTLQAVDYMDNGAREYLASLSIRTTV